MGHYRENRDKKWGYIKIHVGVDVRTSEVIDLQVTDERVSDAEVSEKLIKNSNKMIEGIKAVVTDGGYDRKEVYENCEREGVYLITKPRKDAKKGRHWQRDVLITLQKEKSQIYKIIYGKRWLAETFFSRFKCTFGENVFSRKPGNITKEIILKASILNKFLYKTGLEKTA